MWLSLIRTCSPRREAVVDAAAAAHRVLFQGAQARRRLAGVDDPHRGRSRPRRSANRRARVAMPESRCRKLSAVRSAVSSEPVGPRSRSTIRPCFTRAPSRAASAARRSAGSTRAKTRAATFQAADHEILAGGDQGPRAVFRLEQRAAGEIAKAGVLRRAQGRSGGQSRGASSNILSMQRAARRRKPSVEDHDLVGARIGQGVADLLQGVELHVGAEPAAADEVLLRGLDLRGGRPGRIRSASENTARPVAFTYFIIAPVLPTKSAAAATSGGHSGWATTLQARETAAAGLRDLPGVEHVVHDAGAVGGDDLLVAPRRRSSARRFWAISRSGTNRIRRAGQPGDDVEHVARRDADVRLGLHLGRAVDVADDGGVRDKAP